MSLSKVRRYNCTKFFTVVRSIRLASIAASIATSRTPYSMDSHATSPNIPPHPPFHLTHHPTETIKQLGHYQALSSLMALLNAITSAPRNVTARALLRAELGRVGFDDYVDALLTLSSETATTTTTAAATTTATATSSTTTIDADAEQQQLSKTLMLLMNQAMSYQMSSKRDLVELDATFDETSFDHVFNR